MTNKSVFRALTSVALATGLVAASSAVSAKTTADLAFSSSLLTAFDFFNVDISASGTGTYTGGTFSANATDLLPGGTSISLDPAAALTFNVQGQGALTFSKLVYDSTASSVTANLHFVGAITKDFTNVTVFSTGAVTPALTTLLTGGSVSTPVTLSQAGLSGVATALGITVPVSNGVAGTLKFTATAVPEPSTWALGLSGLMAAAVAGVVRRRRQA